jgi:threonine/homoserine/homoserine lactone efflux protein
LGILSGGLPRLILRREKFLDIFNRICGLFLIYLSSRLIINSLRA